MWVELDEDVWPERKSLVGLRFANDEDFERAQALLPGESWEFYREVYPGWRMLVVRKTEAQRWHDAGLPCEEVEQLDDADLTLEERRERDREALDYWKQRLFKQSTRP